MVLLCTSDSAIETVSEKIHSSQNYLVCHTSGATHISTLKKHKRRCVFYPLQSFNKEDIRSFNGVPLLVESNNTNDLEHLFFIAQKIKAMPIECNSLERHKYHLSAVLTNNFGNHLMSLTADYLKRNHLKFDLLKPLLIRSINNLENKLPQQIQTGPAKRNDTKSIEKHIELLDNEKELKSIYELLTNSITNYYKTTSNEK